jgi:hypothetical protein
MTSSVASGPSRGLLWWCFAAFPLIGAVLPYVIQVCVYAKVGSAIGDRPFLDPVMIFNAVPFVVVTLLSLGQLSRGVGRWISSVAMILIAAASTVLLLNAFSSWMLALIAMSMVGVALAAWYGDAAVRRAGIIGSAIGVFGLSVLWNATLWRAVFLRLPGFSTWPVGFIFSTINVLFAGVLLGYLGGLIVYVMIGVASRLRPDATRPDRR